MQPKAPGQLRKSYSVTQSNLDVFFTFGALYDGIRQQMSKEGIFLQRLDGTIVGAEISSVSEETACDGCAVPTYKESLQADVMNLFAASAFAYPVLMLDTSTAEGRAISLTTFTDKGQFAACSSPKAYTGLAKGKHTFRVQAIDSVGNVERPVRGSRARARRNHNHYLFKVR